VKTALISSSDNSSNLGFFSIKIFAPLHPKFPTLKGRLQVGATLWCDASGLDGRVETRPNPRIFFH
ncbi:MAG: hypothetical protein Q7K21_04495, partial [Elusimicrobiota bacterium]|nr:hypothetical protein [Elusimicrobiota bacterium]